jgi:hypothetical protein
MGFVEVFNTIDAVQPPSRVSGFKIYVEKL